MSDKSFAFFSALYPPHMGGVETFTQGLATAIAAHGHRVIVVTNDTEGMGEGIKCENGFEVMRLPCLPVVSGRLPLPRFSRERRMLLAELAARPLDGVLVNARFYTHSLLGMSFARKRGITPVVLDHGSAYLSFGNALLDLAARTWERALTARGRRYGAAYYGISQKSVEWLGRLGIRAEGIVTNAIDLSAWQASSSGRDFRSEMNMGPDTLLVASVGRLIPEKGVLQIIEASRDARISEAGVTFVLAGDGPLAEEVRAAEGPCLHWLGRLGRPDTVALLNQANLLCLPSRSEGFATTLLESAASGCPALVTDVGGAREVCGEHGEAGRIVTDSSAETIAEHILELNRRRSDLVEMGERARERVVQRFSWECTAASVEEAFARLSHS